MIEEKMKLPEMEGVQIVGGLHPKIMEIFDPAPDLWKRLTREELLKIVQVSFKYQNRLIELEIERLKSQSQALGELQKVIKEFRG